ncbi:MAG TPA: adenylate/guanylate cyclase domain-containing protein [Abditibacteriaceae bacterium]|jgi:adenylate cyclase
MPQIYSAPVGSATASEYRDADKRRRVVFDLGLVALALLLTLLLRYQIPFTRVLLDGAELRLLDARFLLRESIVPEERARNLRRAAQNVAIVALDDTATRRFGRVLPRAVHARLVQQLQRAGARAIIFDIIFVDPERARPRDDVEFARACARAGQVFLPFDDNSSQRTPQLVRAAVEAQLSYPLKDAASLATSTRMDTVRLQPPLEPLLRAMQGGGHVVMNADSDGKYRKAILLLDNGAIYPHVALDAVRSTSWHVPHTGIKQDGNFLQLGGQRIGPLERRTLTRSVFDEQTGKVVTERAGAGWMIPLNFIGNHRAMQNLTVPYTSVLEGHRSILERLHNRVVIVGETATGTTDLRPSPLDTNEVFLGVETNATLLVNLLQNDFLRYSNWRSTLGIMALVGVLVGLVVIFLRPWVALTLSFALALAFALLGIYVFTTGRLVIEMTGPLLAILLCYLVPSSQRLMREEGMARELAQREAATRQLLGQYVDTRIMTQLRDDPAAQRDLEIGVRREVTILFSDIRGFTAWSETQEPEAVSARLDEYFPLMCEIAADDYDGFVDKYIGDALMVVWNAFGDQPNHAECAVRAALSMQRGLRGLNDGWRKQKQQEFRIGIGIATGRVVFGSFGSRRHKLQPTALGDAVNLASRLENATKETGANIIISGATYEAVRDSVHAESLGAIPIRGKSQAVPMYAVLSLREKADASYPA